MVEPPPISHLFSCLQSAELSTKLKAAAATAEGKVQDAFDTRVRIFISYDFAWAVYDGETAKSLLCNYRIVSLQGPPLMERNDGHVILDQLD